MYRFDFRFEVPNDTLVRPSGRHQGLNTPIFKVEYCSSPFGVKVIRLSTGKAIFDTCAQRDFAFADQFLQLTVKLPSDNVYGFGEQTAHRFKRDMNWRRWTMWARDEGVWNNSYNLYGVQPFYLCLEDEAGNSHGVLLASSNAMEVVLQPSPAITWITIGGILDFYVFLGSTPDSAIQRYVSAIGRPILPPYWALGFQLCRWGYQGTRHIEEVEKRMRDYGIPLDGQWVDIDYMYNYEDFTYDRCSEKWRDLPSLIERIHSMSMKFVPILDSGIAARSDGPCNTTYSVFPDGLTSGVYEIDFDGIWIDMNEPSNFNDGNNYDNPNAHQCRHNNWNYPPYTPPVDSYQVAGLFGKTLCMDAKQFINIHYNLHSLYGHSMSKATNNALSEIMKDKRPFILTRSNYVSTGHYAFHWLGDNQALWPEMRWSIVGMLEYNLFGINMVGSDICGFVFNTTKPLCQRWTHLGAFYPFSRNHNINGGTDQDPAYFGPQFARSAGKILHERYRLLPYMYSQLFASHTNGSAAVRALFFEFPGDRDTWPIEDQFLWGRWLMISPVLEEVSSRQVYYPDARWYDYFTHEARAERKQNITRACDEDCIIVDVRGGGIIPMQTPSLTTTESRRNPMQLLVALDDRQLASGFLFLDDGESTAVYNNNYTLVQFEVKSKNEQSTSFALTCSVEKSNQYLHRTLVNEVLIMGVKSTPTFDDPTVKPEYNESKHFLRLAVSFTLNDLSRKEIVWHLK
ncbi:unnamed protein product [Soboliphyme baturini]|uniref:Maltase n=1 Tax=Soboliphyme baturini TaxID=241478 RepID=A0A3P8BMC4_9BILA|nr:unnamed protein product [Soboliphyme baturini]